MRGLQGLGARVTCALSLFPEPQPVYRWRVIKRVDFAGLLTVDEPDRDRVTAEWARQIDRDEAALWAWLDTEPRVANVAWRQGAHPKGHWARDLFSSGIVFAANLLDGFGADQIRQSLPGVYELPARPVYGPTSRVDPLLIADEDLRPLDCDGCHGLFRGSRAEEFRAWLRACFDRFVISGYDLLSSEFATPIAPIEGRDAWAMIEAAEAAGWIRRGAYEPSPSRLALTAHVPQRGRVGKGYERQPVDFMWTPNLNSEDARRCVQGCDR